MQQPISSAGFREALSQFASGVTIVAVRQAAGLSGFTATGFSSVSLAPPLILVCVNKIASAHGAFVAAECFGVSVLAEQQAWIATQFARSGVDRFAGIPMAREGLSGVPLIRDALAHIVCRRHAVHDAGDHTIVIGEVLEACVTPGRPLVHFSRQFGAFHQGVSACSSALASAVPHGPP
ncbi:MAG: flavin reductase family protein [Polyangiaceae bacterium]|jgi:flavin reductase ActVB